MADEYHYEPDYVVGNVYRKIVDRPSDANAWGRWDADKIDVEDAAFAFLRMKNGATVELECSTGDQLPHAERKQSDACGHDRRRGPAGRVDDQ